MLYKLREILAPDEETLIECAFNLNDDYIGDRRTAEYLCDKRGINPELANKANSVCTIGFCKKEQKWYGWSHRAICGFGVGDNVKLGDCAYVGSTPEELIEDYVNFYADEHSYPDPEVLKAKQIELRNHCVKLPHDRGILIKNPGIVAEATVINSIDEFNEAINEIPRQTQLIPAHERVVLCGKGEWVAKTLEDAKQMAIDYAKAVA